mmetsp:Transcript_27082/g.46966  ORF Transcript_27082/g.46966 Transcript_27082/m.46966 type:complete len:125 (+) Transcript_27082:145-519(+)
MAIQKADSTKAAQKLDELQMQVVHLTIIIIVMMMIMMMMMQNSQQLRVSACKFGIRRAGSRTIALDGARQLKKRMAIWFITSSHATTSSIKAYVQALSAGISSVCVSWTSLIVTTSWVRSEASG